MDRYNNYGTGAQTCTPKSEPGLLSSLLEKAISGLNAMLPNKRTFTRCDGSESGMNLSMIGGQPRKIKIMTFYDSDDDTSCAIYDRSNDHAQNSTEAQGGGNYEVGEENDDAPSTFIENAIANAQQYMKDVGAMISGTPSSSVDIQGCPMSASAYDRIL